MKQLLVFIYCALIALSAYASPKTTPMHLANQEVQRVKVLKQVLHEVENKTVEQMVSDLEKTSHPRMNLIIKEAMARTYADIVQEQNVQRQSQKEWIYSMVALNMAYFQFGGNQDSAGGVKNLNKLIRSKLKLYLPPDISKQPGFLTSLG